MERFYPNTYYMTVYEEFKQKDGSESAYSRIMFNPSTWSVGGSVYIRTKVELKEKVEKYLTDSIGPLDDYTVTETASGWVYQRFVTWSEDERNYEVIKEGVHSDHEAYTVDISYYEDVENVFSRLK